jgi:putative peptidoglycan lipid II flippase
LQALALGLVPFSVYLFTLRGFYAQQDTRTPFFVNAAENGVNVVLALALFPAFGVQGLGLAYAGAYLVAALAALSLLAGRIGPITELVLPTAVRALAGAAVLAIVAAPLAAAIGRSSPARAALAVAVAGAAGAGAYLLTLVFVRASEAGAVLRAVRRPRERPAGGQNV